MQKLKLLEESIYIKLHIFELVNSFLAIIAKKKKREKKQIIYTYQTYQTKNFCTSMDTIKKVKRQHTKLDKISTNHLSDNGPVSRICKELLQLKPNNPKFLNG